MKRIQVNASYAVMQGASWSTYAVIMVFATNFLQAKGMPIYQISLLLGTATACSCLLQVQMGELVSRVRKVKGYMVLLALCVLMGVCGIAMMSKNTVISVIGMGVACVLLQTCPGMVNSAGMDAITRGAPAQYGLARGLGSLTYSGVVQVVGILVAGFSVGVLPIAFILVSVCLALGTVWFHRCAETDLPSTWQEAARNQQKNGNFWKENPKFLFLLIGIVLVLMGHNLLNSYMEIIVNAKNGGPAEQGTAMAICSAVELPIMAAFPILERRIRCNKLLQISVFGFAVRSLGLFFGGRPSGHIYRAGDFGARRRFVYCCRCLLCGQSDEAGRCDPRAKLFGCSRLYWLFDRHVFRWYIV